ncbi:MAG: RNA polymerase sigma factor [Desulfobulbaceae bacterium]|nr:RNA polymerase sigma factor [Desulfobulbaceae bacterium]
MNTFQTFYTDNKERLFGYLLRKTGNTQLAADVMQESFTRCLERYSDREYNRSLLFTISRNLLYDQARKNRHETPYEDEQHGVDIDQENIYQVREESKLVLAALQQLDDEEQDILALVVSSGLSYREIAAMTGNSEANIKVKVHRSRLKLRKILKQERS